MTYEYRIEIYNDGDNFKDTLIKKLNELGNDGWELCGCVAEATTSFVYFFKRSIEEYNHIQPYD